MYMRVLGSVMLLALAACGEPEIAGSERLSVLPQDSSGTAIVVESQDPEMCSTPLGGGEAFADAYISEGCLDCSVENLEGAIDLDNESVTHLTVNVGAVLTADPVTDEYGYTLLRARAQDGVVFPAGSVAGAELSIPEGIQRGTYLAIATTLAGKIQEKKNVIPDITDVYASSSEPFFLGLETRKEFDGISIYLSALNTGIQTPPGNRVRAGAAHGSVDVHEFCSDRTFE